VCCGGDPSRPVWQFKMLDDNIYHLIRLALSSRRAECVLRYLYLMHFLRCFVLAAMASIGIGFLNAPAFGARRPRTGALSSRSHRSSLPLQAHLGLGPDLPQAEISPHPTSA